MKCVCDINHYAKNPDGFCDSCGKYTEKMYYNKKELLWECKSCKKPRKQRKTKKHYIKNPLTAQQIIDSLGMTKKEKILLRNSLILFISLAKQK